MSLKALARAVLDRNQQGNSPETSWRKQGNFGGVKPAKKFPLKLTYVACMDCANLDGDYCKAWNDYPTAVEYECRLCKKFVRREL